MYNKLVRKAEENHYLEHFEEIRKDIKATWKSVNELIGRGKGNKNSIPKEFLNEDRSFQGLDEISEGFNEYFTSVGDQLLKKIKPPKTKYNMYLSAKEENVLKFRTVSEETP